MDPFTLTILIGVPVLLLSGAKKSTQSIQPTQSITKYPKGKGLIIEQIPDISRDEFFSDINTLGIQWLAVLTHHQEDTENDGIVTHEYLSTEKLSWLLALNEKGIKIWFYAYPNAYDIDNFIKICKKYESKKYCQGYIVAISHSFFKVKNAGQVLASSIKKNLTKSVGITKEVPTPELEYFRNFNFGLAIPTENIPIKQNLENWKNYFNVVIPVWGRDKKIPIDVIISSTPPAPAYSFIYEQLKEIPSLFEFVKNFKWDKLQNNNHT